jgi:hypothetical protein
MVKDTSVLLQKLADSFLRGCRFTGDSHVKLYSEFFLQVIRGPNERWPVYRGVLYWGLTVVYWQLIDSNMVGYFK